MTVLKPGISIIEHVMQNIESINGEFNRQVEPAAEAADPLREFLLKNGHIVPFNEKDLRQKSLATVDGAHVVEQRALADICISGSAIGEGAQSHHVYARDTETPTLADYRVVPHNAINVDMNRALMAAQEISLMSMIDHNIRILDGSWASSMTSIYLGLLDNDNLTVPTALVDWLARSIEDGMLAGHEVAEGLDRLMAPWRYLDADTDVVALSKSDSSSSYVKKFLNAPQEPEFYSILDQAHGGQGVKVGQERTKADQFASLYSDRALASMVLHPGEMFVPRSVAAGRSLATRLDQRRWQGKGDIEFEPGKVQKRFGKPGIYKAVANAVDDGYYSPDTLDVVRETFITGLFEGGYQVEGSTRASNESPHKCMLRLDDHSNRDSHGERWIWTSYMKPRLFTNNQAAMKLDYARTEEAGTDKSMVQVCAEERGRDLAGYINADVVNPEIQEAFSQYAADKKAKDVSRAANMLRQHIISSTESERIAAGFIRNYRT